MKFSEKISYSKQIRKSFLGVVRHYSDENALYNDVESEYQICKKELSEKINQEASESSIKQSKISFFYISTVLFTFGRLDVAEDILDNLDDIKDVRSRIYRFAGVLNLFLPLPSGFNFWTNRYEIKEWLNRNRSQLRWDENVERFILNNFNILPNVSENSELKEFKFTGTGKDKENTDKYENEFIVEVISKAGNKWLGSFQGGYSDFSGVYQHPNQNDLIVVSQGRGYIVNPESQELLESFAGNIYDVVYIPYDWRNNIYYLFFINDSILLCYDSSGLRWENTEIPWNQIREVEFNDFRLTGEFYCFQENNWKQFWFNFIKNEFHLGEFKWEDLSPKTKRPWWQFW